MHSLSIVGTRERGDAVLACGESLSGGSLEGLKRPPLFKTIAHDPSVPCAVRGTMMPPIFEVFELRLEFRTAPLPVAILNTHPLPPFEQSGRAFFIQCDALSPVAVVNHCNTSMARLGRVLRESCISSTGEKNTMEDDALTSCVLALRTLGDSSGKQVQGSSSKERDGGGGGGNTKRKFKLVPVSETVVGCSCPRPIRLFSSDPGTSFSILAFCRST